MMRLVDERYDGNEEAVVRTEDHNTVLRTWAASGEKSAAALRVEQILIDMQEMCAAGNANVQPNVDSFEIAVEAWIRATDEPHALSRSQKILE